MSKKATFYNYEQQKSQTYTKNTDTIKAPQTDNPRAMLITIFDELLNSINAFQSNIIPSSDTFRKIFKFFKSTHDPVYATK